MRSNESTSGHELIDAGLVEAKIMQFIEEHRGEVEELVAARPHVALACAAGVGFVLGGGLTPRRLLQLALAVATPALSRMLFEATERAAAAT